jgi:hypothetical protein
MLNACQDDTAKAYEACQAVFTTLNQFFLATPSPQTLASQTIAIQHLDALFAELHPFSEEQRFEFMATTLNSIDFEASGLRTHFLKMLNRLICNNGFEKVSVLGRVYESVLNWTFEAVQKESFAPKSSSPGVVTELAVEVLNSSLGCLKEMPREIQEKVMLSIPKEMWLEVLTFSLKTQLHSRSSSLESQIEVRIGNHQSLGIIW